MKGQLSAEMLILLALVLGLLFVAYSYMSKSVVSTGKDIDKKTAQLQVEGTPCDAGSTDACSSFDSAISAHCDTEKRHCVMDSYTPSK